MNFQPEQKIVCPHCQEEWEYPAKDYVLPDSPLWPLGADKRSDSQCGHCDEWSSCIKQSDGSIEVEAIDGEGGDYL